MVSHTAGLTAACLANALGAHWRLRQLDLSNNPVGGRNSPALHALCRALRDADHGHVVSLKLSGCSLSGCVLQQRSAEAVVAAAGRRDPKAPPIGDDGAADTRGAPAVAPAPAAPVVAAAAAAAAGAWTFRSREPAGEYRLDLSDSVQRAMAWELLRLANLGQVRRSCLALTDPPNAVHTGVPPQRTSQGYGFAQLRMMSATSSAGYRVVLSTAAQASIDCCPQGALWARWLAHLELSACSRL